MKLVKDVMTKKVVTVRDEDDVKQACKLLAKNRISGMPVMNRLGRLVGFISERDVIAAVPKPGFDKASVRKLMTKKVRTIAGDEPLTHASKIFSEEDYRLLPVMKGPKLIGIIARKDVVNFMMGNFY